MATLKVKNDSGGSITLTHGNGTDTVTIADGENKGLDEGYLLGTDFASKLKAGQLVFVAPATPTADELRLARQVFPILLRRVGANLVGLHVGVVQSIETLDGLRRGYNDAHAITKGLVTQGKAGAEGAAGLATAAGAWLTVEPEQKVVDDAEKAILDHKAVVIAPGGFESWYATLQTLEQDLAQAERALAFAKSRYVDDYAKLVADLGTAGTELATLDPTTSIGKEVPGFP